jgi:hypothetical protein
MPPCPVRTEGCVSNHLIKRSARAPVASINASEGCRVDAFAQLGSSSKLAPAAVRALPSLHGYVHRQGHLRQGGADARKLNCPADWSICDRGDFTDGRLHRWLDCCGSLCRQPQRRRFHKSANSVAVDVSERLECLGDANCNALSNKSRLELMGRQKAPSRFCKPRQPLPFRFQASACAK